MVNINTMDKLKELGFESDIDGFESYVFALQAAASNNEPLVTDTVYDQMMALLKQVKPESELHKVNWEQVDNDYDDYDALLRDYGMSSIKTLQSIEEVLWFANNLQVLMNKYNKPVIEVMASIKENGNAIRAVYAAGKLVSGSTRGRTKKGRDIVRHLKQRIPNEVPEWKNIPLVEIRGEALVPYDRFNKYLKSTLKTPLSSVASMIKESASSEEIDMLDFVFYRVLTSKGHEYPTLQSEYEVLEENGFEVPINVLLDEVTPQNIGKLANQVLMFFGQMRENKELEYDSDGIVFSINDNTIFYDSGREDRHWKGNFALKAGIWESSMYSAEILDIEYAYGATYITPKAIIVPTTAANGSTVDTVPLYNIGVMEKYSYYPGRTIYFKFGGETGVTCCDAEGNKVTSKD